MMFLLSIFALSIFLVAFSVPDAHATTFELNNNDSNGVCENEIGGTWDSNTSTCTANSSTLNFITLQIDNGVTVNYQGGAGIINQVNGIIDNFGTITINSGGGFSNIGPIATVNNSGTININSASISSGGPFYNSGTINLNSGSTFSVDSTVNNSGTINVNSGGSINNDYIINVNSGGSINNYGAITNHPGGTITNQPGGTIANPGIITNDCGATFTNDGTLTGNAVILCGTTTTLTSSQNPSPVGQSVTFTATISPNTATGIVTFNDSNTIIGTGTVTNGVVSIATSSLSIGTHSITAKYSGDSNHQSSTSSILGQKINQMQTTTTLLSSQNPSTHGQSVTFTATVSPITTTGTVSFKDGATTLGTGTLSGGSATYTTSTLAVGSHSINATYSGDTNDAESTNTITQTVNKITTTTTLLSSSNSLNPGQPVTLTATVSPVVHDGETITFLNDTTTIGAGTTTGGVATFTGTLSIGSYTITASYPGDSNDTASTSDPVTIAVLSLLGEKQSVIPSLLAITPAGHDDQQDFKQAIDAVQDSVNANLWQSDGIHLVVKKGDKVFDYEKQAVDHLTDIIKEKKESSSVVTTLQNDISTLTDVDQKLATTAISDANTAANGLTGDHAKDAQSDISQAQKEMTQASDEISKGQFAAGIEHYSNAWRHAEDAITDVTQNNH